MKQNSPFYVFPLLALFAFCGVALKATAAPPPPSSSVKRRTLTYLCVAKCPARLTRFLRTSAPGYAMHLCAPTL